MKPVATTPWSSTLELRGEADDIDEVVRLVERRLRDESWEVDVTSDDAVPARRGWTIVAWRGDESIVATLAPSAGHRPTCADQFSLVAVGSVHSDSENLSLANYIFRHIPFTAYERRSHARTMPLTSSIASQIHNWVPDVDPVHLTSPFEGFAGIFTIHHQTDFVVLLERALELGIERELCTVIDKEYRYPHTERVDSTIRESLGIPVFRFSEINNGIADHLHRVVADLESRQSRQWRPTIVLDDGGYVLPCLQKHFEDSLSLFHGLVEQTTSGIWAIRRFDPIRLPVFSVAESDLKRTVEAHGVAMAAVTNLRRLLPHEKFDGRLALVVGYGRVGEALVEVLQKFHLTVVVAESDFAQAVTARERGLQVYESVEEALVAVAPSFLFSCAEPGAVTQLHYQLLRQDTILVSLTSRDKAFDKDGLADAATTIRQAGTIGTVYTLRGANVVDVLLIGDGFPVNFHYSESMPNAQSDLVMSSLLVGAVHLCTSTPPWPPGNDAMRANGCLNGGSLLRDFFRHGYTSAPTAADRSPEAS